MKIVAGLLCCAALGSLVFGFMWTEPRQSPVASPSHSADAADAAEVSLTQPLEREPVPARLQEAGDVKTPVAEPTVAPAAGAEWNKTQLLSEVQRLQLALDECQNGPESVLATMYALPEWSGLTEEQRAMVKSFVGQFPVTLLAGEATMIATYDGGEFTKDTIQALGRARVLHALDAITRQNMGANELYELFGDLVPRPPE